MKKLTIFMMLAALAMPAMQANKVIPTPASRNGAKAVPAAFVQNATWGSKTVANKAEAMTWDFESEDQIADWTFIDNDGDGYNWTYFNNTGLTSGRMTAHNGEGLIASASYMNNESGSGGTALNPDNWMISPQMELGGRLSFWAAGQDASYAAEVFAVYVCEGVPTGIDDFVKISDDLVATGEYVEYEFSLKEYAGKTGCFAIRHYNITDMFWLNVDDITLDPNYVVLDAPTNVTADPAATSAKISWVDPNGEDATAWNLRYHEYDPDASPEPMTFDFDSALDPWTAVDADGDGYNWAIETNSNYGFTGAMSGSYISGAGALDPDNWLISPCFKLGGSLKFDVTNHSSSFPEKFGVYVFEGDQWTAVTDFTPIAENLQTSAYGSNFETLEYDLGNYSGMGYVAIRNYGTHDQWKMYIDNVVLTPGVEWTVVNGVTENPYTIEGLTPETEYVAQVQAVAGRYVSPWSDPVNFTTLAEGQEETKYYITGGFNGWLTQDPPELTEEGYTFTAVDDPEGDHPLDFKLLTWGGEDWIWIGGISENEGVDYFDVTDEMMENGQELSLYAGPEYVNFRLPEAGTYKVTLLREQIAKDPLSGVKIVVSKENDPTPTAVNDINSKAVAGVKYYNLAGVESNKPFDGVNIMVTTYTDGTKAAAKVIK